MADMRHFSKGWRDHQLLAVGLDRGAALEQPLLQHRTLRILPVICANEIAGVAKVYPVERGIERPHALDLTHAVEDDARIIHELSNSGRFFAAQRLHAYVKLRAVRG